jgi:cytochrome c
VEVNMNGRIFALTLLGFVPAAQGFAQEDGQTAFNSSCRTCHTMKEGDHRQGPSLAGVIGRKAGTAPGYNFSDSMKQSGIVWDEANLDKFIANPDQVVNGNTMKPYGGITDAAQRKTIIEFMKTGG